MEVRITAGAFLLRKEYADILKSWTETYIFNVI